MDDAPVSQVLAEYDEKADTYGMFASKVAALLADLIADRGIALQSITYRLKDRESLEKKLLRPSAHYAGLADVTDVAGVRVICYFAEDVDRVAQIIESEFTVDVDNTTDKRKLLDSDRFGYLSLHHIVSLRDDRATLTEYRRIAKLKVEIQSRSLLQHAWAEIEHDIGYKRSGDVPRHVRRKFSRVAGFLELADQEFDQIRSSLGEYEKNLPASIEKAPGAVLLDRASLAAFIATEPLVRILDQRIAASRDTSVNY